MFGISWWIWAAGALGIALIYTVLPHPHPKIAVAAWQRWVLRWGHSLVWVVLALSCVIRAVDPTTNLANGVALMSLPLYGLFLSTVIRSR